MHFKIPNSPLLALELCSISHVGRCQFNSVYVVAQGLLPARVSSILRSTCSASQEVVHERLPRCSAVVFEILSSEVFFPRFKFATVPLAWRRY